MTLNEIGVQAKTASRMLQKMGQKEKNALLECAAGLLVENIPKLIEANDKDIANARQKGIKDALICLLYTSQPDGHRLKQQDEPGQ